MKVPGIMKHIPENFISSTEGIGILRLPAMPVVCAIKGVTWSPLPEAHTNH